LETLSAGQQQFEDEIISIQIELSTLEKLNGLRRVICLVITTLASSMAELSKMTRAITIRVLATLVKSIVGSPLTKECTLYIMIIVLKKLLLSH
jgi:hypothetical protein